MMPHFHPTLLDPRALHAALRDHRALVQRALLGLAWSATPIPDENRDDPFAPTPRLALPDPGGFEGVLAAIFESPEANDLAKLGVDPGLLALWELERMERAALGPKDGSLRADHGHGALWRQLEAVLTEDGPLAERAASALGNAPRALPAPIRRAWESLAEAAYARHAASFVRMAASDGAAAPMVCRIDVDGAPGWRLQLTASPTLDGAWLYILRRDWTGAGEAPTPPRIAATLRDDGEPWFGVIESEPDEIGWVTGHPPGLSAKLRARLAFDDEGT